MTGRTARTNTLNLCAGPGGWETGASILDSSTVVTGFDVSADACATARAAGYHRVQADVRSLEPADFPDITGLIVSPPCPTFSSGGLRSALSGDDYQHALDAITCLGEGCLKTWHHLPGKVSDPRTALVVETARIVLRLPAVKWVIAEQVPSVEFLWEDLAAELGAAGWEYMNVETIDAHDLGAVARRRRTFLLGCRYTAAGHIPFRELPGLGTPTMAEALGWDTGHRIRTRNQRRPTGGNLFSADGPAWCLTEKNRSWERDSDRLRLTPGEAGLLQGFPASYPWTGSRTSQFRQVGDVVSPVVAAALIGALTRVDWEPVLRDYLAGLYRRSPEQGRLTVRPPTQQRICLPRPHRDEGGCRDGNGQTGAREGARHLRAFAAGDDPGSAAATGGALHGGHPGPVDIAGAPGVRQPRTRPA